MIKLNTSPSNIVILQVQFPTFNSKEEEIEIMYEHIERTLKSKEKIPLTL